VDVSLPFLLARTIVCALRFPILATNVIGHISLGVIHLRYSRQNLRKFARLKR
jgi:uncharacterized membrane protein